MKIPKRIETSLQVLSAWYDSADELRTVSPVHRRTSLRWKAIGIIQHDRLLNGKSVALVPSALWLSNR